MADTKWVGTSAIGLIIAILVSSSFKENPSLQKDAKETLHLSLSQREHFGKAIAAQDGIKLVAFGDSITAGLDSQYGYGAGGYRAGDKIYGLGYPAFVARYLEQIVPGSVHQFMNFGISGTTTDHWIYLLGIDEWGGKILNNNSVVNTEVGGYTIQTTATPLQIIYNYMVQNAQESPFEPVRNRLIEAFGGRAREVDRDKFLAAVRGANVMMLTLGANDVFASGVFIRAIGLVKDHPEAWPGIRDELHTVWDLVRDHLVVIIERLRELNPTARLNFVAYPLALTRIADMLDELLPIPEDEPFSRYFSNGLNGAMKRAVITYNEAHTDCVPAEYIDDFDEEFWLENADRLVEDPFSIHPTTLGYQTMGRTIFLKMTQKDHDPGWTSSFLANDWNCYDQQVETGFPDDVIRTKIGGIFENNPFTGIWGLPEADRIKIAATYLWRHVRKAADFNAAWEAFYLDNFATHDGHGTVRELMGLGGNDDVRTMWFHLIVGAGEASPFFMEMIGQFAAFIRGKAILDHQDLINFWRHVVAETKIPLMVINELFENGFMETYWEIFFGWFLGRVLHLDGLGSVLKDFYELSYNMIGQAFADSEREFAPFEPGDATLAELWWERLARVADTVRGTSILMDVAKLLPNLWKAGAEKQWFRIITFARYVMAKFDLNGQQQIERFVKMTLKRDGIRDDVSEQIMRSLFGAEINKLIEESAAGKEGDRLAEAIIRGAL